MHLLGKVAVVMNLAQALVPVVDVVSQFFTLDFLLLAQPLEDDGMSVLDVNVLKLVETLGNGVSELHSHALHRESSHSMIPTFRFSLFNLY